MKKQEVSNIFRSIYAQLNQTISNYDELLITTSLFNLWQLPPWKSAMDFICVFWFVSIIFWQLFLLKLSPNIWTIWTLRKNSTLNLPKVHFSTNFLSSIGKIHQMLGLQIWLVLCDLATVFENLFFLWSALAVCVFGA